MGNKGRNLGDNTQLIEASGFKVPRSMDVPHEYIQDARGNIDDFILELFDRFFPDWKRLVVRSNDSDEDLKGRNPGMYTSDEVWHKDREFVSFPIGRVLDSYYSLQARSVRAAQGLEKKRMGLLVQEPVTNDKERYYPSDVNNSGSFSDMGEYYQFTLTDFSEGLKAMQRPALGEFRIRKDETYTGEHQELVEGLIRLTESLPKRDGKKWELEFVTNDDGTYIVQTTPIAEQGIVFIEENESTIFMPSYVVGIREVETEGIVYTPFFTQRRGPLSLLSGFNETHQNYCVATVHALLKSNQGALYEIGGRYKVQFNITDHIHNASALLDITLGLTGGHDFAPHLKQWMREDRVAMLGRWTIEMFEKLLVSDDFGFRGTGGILYSPTRLRLKADEYLEKGVVQVVGDIMPFIPLEQYMGR
jgi:hypothetical protein